LGESEQRPLFEPERQLFSLPAVLWTCPVESPVDRLPGWKSGNIPTTPPTKIPQGMPPSGRTRPPVPSAERFRPNPQHKGGQGKREDKTARGAKPTTTQRSHIGTMKKNGICGVSRINSTAITTGRKPLVSRSVFCVPGRLPASAKARRLGPKSCLKSGCRKGFPHRRRRCPASAVGYN
jgi:hypothetical protein